MDQKIGVYLCSGCGIGESIDLDALGGVAKEFKIAKCESHPALCSAEGVDIINKDLASDAVNCMVVGACSGRVKSDVFSFDPMTTILERVNLREHVAWCQPAGHEDTQMMAEDYIRMGVTKVLKSTLPKPFQEGVEKTILVVGGGAAGLQASLEAAQADYSVMLVEKENELGGHMVKWHKSTPTGPNYHDLSEITIDQTIAAVQANSNIKVLTGTTIEKIAGAPGMFDVTLSNGGGAHKIGSIVMAAGWKPVRRQQARTPLLWKVSRHHHKRPVGRNGQGREDNLPV